MNGGGVQVKQTEWGGGWEMRLLPAPERRNTIRIYIFKKRAW